MDEELGLVFQLVDGMLDHLNNLKPLNKDDVEEFIITKSQMENYFSQQTPVASRPQLYWVPFSAFQPMEKTGAMPITEEVLAASESRNEVEELD